MPALGGADGRMLVQVAVAEPGADACATHRVEVPWAAHAPGRLLALVLPPGAHTEAVRAAWARNGVRVREISDIVDGRVTGDDSADIVVGTPEAWLAQWRLLALARERGTIVVDAACAAEFRAVTGSRELPPFAASGAGRAWLVEPGTPARRVRLPGA